MFTRLFIASVLACVLGVAAQAAAKIKSQLPCAAANGLCRNVGADTSVEQVIRNFSFTAPSKGVAQVTFHGSLVCTDTEGLANRASFVSQILANNEELDATKAGYLRHEAVMDTYDQSYNSKRVSFNLHSTRVYDFAGAGAANFKFVLKRQNIGVVGACAVYTGTFSVVFIP